MANLMGIHWAVIECGTVQRNSGHNMKTMCQFYRVLDDETYLRWKQTVNGLFGLYFTFRYEKEEFSLRRKVCIIKIFLQK